MRSNRSGEYDIGVHFAGEFECEGKRLAFLGVRGANGGEIAVRPGLGFDGKYVSETEMTKYGRDYPVPRPVKRSVHDGRFRGLCRSEDPALEKGKIILNDVVSDDSDDAGAHSLLEVYTFNGLDGVDHSHFVDDLPVDGGHDLAAVLPVYLVTVVFRRIVAGRYNDA